MSECTVKSSPIVVSLDKARLIRVLHVDDEPALLKVAKQCLELQGPFQVDTAGSVEEALSKLKEREYDAVVSDYQMPGQDGLEFLEMLRKNGNAIPFIMFTGKGREEVAVKAWSLGADHYVNKTGDPETVYCELAHCLRSTVEKRFAEAQMKETAQRLQTIYQNAVEGISYVDSEENIVYANKAFADIVGYEQDQLVGMNLREAVDDENWAKIESETERRRQGQSSRYEVEFRRRDGTVRNVLISGAPLLDSDDQFAGTIGIVSDITEQKMTKEAIKDSEERFKSIFESVDDGLIYLDTSGRIIEINKKTAEIFGGSKEELLGKHFTKIGIFSVKEVPTLTKRFVDILRGKRAILDITIKNKKGQAIPLECSASLSKAYGKSTIAVVARDVTERIERERLLRESEEKYRDLFENAMDAIVTLDLRGSITAVNNAALRFGYQKESLVGKNLLDFVSKEYWPAVMRDFSKVTRGEPAKNEIELVVPTGKIIGEYRARAIVKEDNVAGVQISIRDVTDRKKAEEALRLSEEKYKGLFENARDVIVLFDLKGNVTSINKAAEEEYGFKNSEMLGKNMLKFVSKKYWPKLLSDVAQIALGKTAKGKIDIHTPKGDKIAEYRSNPIFSDNRVVGIQTILEDITEREVMEKTSIESEEKWRSLVEMAPDGIYLSDLKGTFIDGNKAAEEITGFKREELIGKSFLKLGLLPKKEILKAATLLAKNALGKPTGPDEITLRQKNGTEVPVEIRTFPVKIQNRTVVLGIARDVTERMKIQKTMKENHAKFQALFVGSPEAGVFLDRDFRIADINPRFEELFGYSLAEIKGKHINDAVVPSDKWEEAQALDNQAIQGYAHRNTWRKRKDGSLVPVSVSAAPVTIEDRLAGYIGIYKDISELRNTQKKLETMNEKLRVVGGLTRHDVRNKLSAITGNIYLHKKKLVDHPDVLEGFKDMESACEQIVRIFEFARDYEKLGVEELVYLNAKKVLDEAIALLPNLGGVRIVNGCDGLMLLADSLLRQLFYNLIDNSLKYGEKLTRIRIHYEESENQLKLVHEDDGVGIPKDIKAKLFNEGFTTGKGSGYGLYLIERMMEVYGWTIDETGMPGKGAQFTIDIPKAKPDGRQNYRLS